MITDVKSTIRTALLSNAALFAMLGGDRIYQLVAPKAEECPRISFFEINNADAAFADDTAYAAEISVQIDVWDKGSTSEIAGEVDKTMKANGWMRTSASDFYEADTKIFHKAIRYRTQIQEVEG